jgi:hypothetical protein
MDKMIKKYDTFINEFKGPNMAAGFRYSKPQTEFNLQFIVSVLNPNITKSDILSCIAESLSEIDVEIVDKIKLRDWIVEETKVTNIAFSFDVKCYSQREAYSIITEINKYLNKQFPFDTKMDNVIVI